MNKEGYQSANQRTYESDRQIVRDTVARYGKTACDRDRRRFYVLKISREGGFALLVRSY